jgi:hypothetical protein
MVIGEYLCVLHKLNAGFKPFKWFYTWSF